MSRGVLFTGFAFNALVTLIIFAGSGTINPVHAIPATILLWIALAIKDDKK